MSVVDINNGARFESYAIPGEHGLMTVQVNGAVARLVYPGDLTIVMSFADPDESELMSFQPVVANSE